jgi:hypothetical protein
MHKLEALQPQPPTLGMGRRALAMKGVNSVPGNSEPRLQFPKAVNPVPKLGGQNPDLSCCATPRLERLADLPRPNGHRHVFLPHILGYITLHLETGHHVEV